MGTINLVFFLAAALVFLFMVTWVVVTVYRLLAPEKPHPVETDPAPARPERDGGRGEQVPVGVRQIREDQRHYQVEHARAPYQYLYGESEGLPTIWKEDLWRRRN